MGRVCLHTVPRPLLRSLWCPLWWSAPGADLLLPDCVTPFPVSPHPLASSVQGGRGIHRTYDTGTQMPWQLHAHTLPCIFRGVIDIVVRAPLPCVLPRIQYIYICTVWCTGRGECILQPSDIPIIRMQPPVYAPPSYREVGVSM